MSSFNEHFPLPINYKEYISKIQLNVSYRQIARLTEAKSSKEYYMVPGSSLHRLFSCSHYCELVKSHALNLLFQSRSILGYRGRRLNVAAARGASFSDCQSL